MTICFVLYMIFYSQIVTEQGEHQEKNSDNLNE